MKYTAGICYGHINLIEKAVILVCLCGSTYAKMEKAYACASADETSNDCIIFNISCNEQEHIFIKKVEYGFRGAQPQGCKKSETECRRKDGQNKGCCTDDSKDEKKPFEVDHKYDIFNTCSWKHRCSKRTPIGVLEGNNSKYSMLEYECQKELKIVHFCKQEQASGQTVDLILDRGEYLVNNSYSNAYSNDCKCILEVDGTDRYQISAPDLRLQSELRSCNSETVISGLTTSNIICNTSFTSILPSRQISSADPRYHPVTVSFKFLPEFIWIKAKAEGKGNAVYVNCFDMAVTSDTTPVPATTSSTSPSATETSFPSTTATANETSESAVSNTTSIPKTTVSIANDLSTSFSTVSDTQAQSSHVQNNKTGHLASTAAADSTTTNRSRVLEVYSPDSNEVPVAAIVIPIILLLVGVGVCLFLWRKWRRRKDKLEKSSNVDNKEDTTAANEINDYNYQNTSDFKTSDNYTVLGIENSYAYIDHGDMKKKSSPESQIGKTSENTYTYIDQADMNKQGAAERKITDPSENSYAYIDHEKVNSMVPTEVIRGVTSTTENSSAYIDLQDVNTEGVTTPNNSSYHSLKPYIGSKSSESDNNFKPCKVELNKLNSPKQTRPPCDSHIYSDLYTKEGSQGDDEAGLLPVQQNRQMTNKPSILHAEDTEGHDYFKLEPQDNSRGQMEKHIDNTNLHDKETDESHNYFLLEAQNTKSSVCSNGTDIRDKHEEEMINNNNYFVLEPQDISSSNNANTVNVHKKEVNDNHNYFVLEPQDDDIRNNEIVGGVQTLPDNEYNVLSLKSETICHDPNYGILKSEQPGNIEDDSADYSYLDKTTVRKQLVPEYSHVQVDKTGIGDCND